MLNPLRWADLLIRLWLVDCGPNAHDDKTDQPSCLDRGLWIKASRSFHWLGMPEPMGTIFDPCHYVMYTGIYCKGRNPLSCNAFNSCFICTASSWKYRERKFLLHRTLSMITLTARHESHSNIASDAPDCTVLVGGVFRGPFACPFPLWRWNFLYQYVMWKEVTLNFEHFWKCSLHLKCTPGFPFSDF